MTATAIANPDSVVARIVAELEHNPEAKTLLLRTLLTDELLALPARVDRIEERLDALIQQLEVLNRKVAAMNAALRTLLEDNLERKVHSNIRNILYQRLPFRFRVRKVLQSITVDSDTALTEALYDAADADRIADSALIGAFAADIILAGRR